MTVVGRIVRLAGARSVFVGRRVGGNSNVYIEFRNGDQVLRFLVSAEAATALWRLLGATGGIGEAMRYSEPDKVADVEWQEVVDP